MIISQKVTNLRFVGYYISYGITFFVLLFIQYFYLRAVCIPKRVLQLNYTSQFVKGVFSRTTTGEQMLHGEGG